MAVDANTYAEHEDVERLIGDIVESRLFTTGTVPTLAQVETELDNAAADLNRELDAAGYTVKVVLATYPTAYAFLKAANAYGAAAVLLSTVPSYGYNPDDEVEAAAESRPTTYSRKFEAAKKAIREHRIRAALRKGRLADVFAGSQEDEDGNEKKPIFKRGMDEYPGAATNIQGASDDED
jgi:thioredoxin-like negative regulator of GroEL